MALQGIQMNGPQTAEGGEPGLYLLERLGPDPVDTALCIHGRLHDTGVAQDAQVLRHGRLRHFEMAFDVPDRLLRAREQAENGAPVRLREHLENGFHARYITAYTYACQGI